MLNYRRALAFSSRLHSYITLMYAVVFAIFLLVLHYSVSDELYNLIVSFSTALGWAIVLEGSFIIISSIYLSIISRVLVLEPILRTLLRLIFYMAVAFVFSFIVSLNQSGLRLGVEI